MARFDSDRFNVLPNLGQEGFTSFLYFIDPNEERMDYDRAGVHKSSILQTSVHTSVARGHFAAKCLLDYIYLWLAEGLAARDCPTYEAYLLTVISIVDHYYHSPYEPGTDDYRDDEMQPLREAHGKDFPVFFFIHGPHYSRGMEEHRQWEEVVKRHQPEGWEHPALARDVYESFRLSVLAEEIDDRYLEARRDSADMNRDPRY